MFERVMDWGYKQGLKQIEEQIQKTIKKKRLAFVGSDKIQYAYKDGRTAESTYDEIIKILIEVGGWQKNMETLGITIENIKAILGREYDKQKEKK